ncbi:cytochrome P450 [Polyplosphaeria fusca]|uniref:Cytochrome P450 n=1 Tax=Polyplosphaeria fusca TaxID=682080 RepID=A0A9P4UU27_9PLEO|nr:cytochrome P450 [Polyplosphaeria fusca]
MSAHPIAVSVGVLLTTGFAYLAVVTYRHRANINRLRKNGFPMPEKWSWFFGHSFALLEYTQRFPPLANIGIPMQELSKNFADTEMFLIDLWPSYPSSVVIFNPEAANLATQKYNLPKPAMAGASVEPIVGGTSILSMNGAEWKKWRSLLNPGFSAASLVNHVPFVVDCVQVFCDKLRELAAKEIFSLDEVVSRLTFDVIMKVALDSDINYQRCEHVLPSSMNTITHWHSFWDPRVLMHPLRPFVQKYHAKKMVTYIQKQIEHRFEELKTQKALSETPASKRGRSVITLALEAFLEEKGDSDMTATAVLDKEFSSIVSNHIRLFLFAGNDTTSSTIAFSIHLMSKHPEALARLREEHDSIFGTDITQTATLLKDQPTLFNQCRYTLAFVKETLRLYPPAANMRLGSSELVLPALNGQMLPTEGLNIILVHQTIHKNPRIWVRPEEFIPDRWLVDPGHELYPPPGAFRPFDIGPRRCIGQELALIEIRMVLIMVARTFKFSPAYEEWNRTLSSNAGVWPKLKEWLGMKELNTVHGDRVYQTEKAGTHPSDGYPCRVSVVD